MNEERQNLQFLRELYHKKIKPVYYQTVWLDKHPDLFKFLINGVRWFLRILRLFKRQNKILPFRIRNAIDMYSSQSMNGDAIWMLLQSNKSLKLYLEGIFDAVESGARPVVWHEWCLTPDLILAFDAQPFCTESLVEMLYFLGPFQTELIIDAGENKGISSEYCSAAKGAVGAYFEGQIPEPDCIVTAAHPCDSMLSSYQTLEYLTGSSMFVLDTPYWNDGRSTDYYIEEIKALIIFLEKHLNRKLDYNRLRSVLNEVNRTNILLMEINEMHRSVPCPGSGMSTILSWASRITGMGTPEITEMTKRLYKMTRKRYESGKGILRREKIRVIWFDVPIGFYYLVLWMEEKFGATVVMDLVSYVNTPQIDTATEETMIRGMAESYRNLSMVRQFHGPIEFYHADLIRICEEYRGDCFIFAGHVGCKHGWAGTRLLRELMKKINMPLLILTSDVFDQRITHEDQLKSHIEDFFTLNGFI